MRRPSGIRQAARGATIVGAAILPLAIARPGLGQSGEYSLDSSREWRARGGAQPGTDEWTMAEARRQLAEDRAKEAHRILTDWLTEFERSGSPLLPEAYLLRGDALLAMDREFDALYDYEAIAKRYRGSEQFPIAIRRELDIAKLYVDGLKLRSLGFRWADSTDIAEELLIRVQERMPRSALAEEAAITLADFYYRQREMDLAREAYDLYLSNFPDGPNRIRAQARRIQTNVARFKGPKYSAAGLINARLQIRDFMGRYPAEADRLGLNEALIARIDESMAAQLYDSATWYLQVGDNPSARFMLKRILRDYPRTVSADRALEHMIAKGWLSEDSQPAIDTATENKPSPEPLGADASPEEPVSDSEVDEGVEPR